MIYKKIRTYVPERAYLAILGIVAAALAAVLNILSYQKLYRFLHLLIVAKDVQTAASMAWTIAGMLILSALVYFTSLLFTHLLGFRLETNLKKHGIQHLMNASFSFFDQNESGRVRKILDDNTVLTHTSIAHLIPDLSTAVFMPLLGIALTFSIDWRLGALFVGTLVVGLLMVQNMMGNHSFMQEYMQSADRMNAGAVEFVRGVPVLKIFKAHIDALKTFHEAVTNYSTLALKYSMSCRIWYVAFQVFFNAVPLALMGLFYLNGMPQNEALAKFMFYMLMNGVLYLSFMKIMYVGMYTMQSNGCIQKIEDLFSQMDKDKMSHGQLEALTGTDIVFKDVTFGYEDQPIFEHLDLSLAGGKTYALVGASGSGKSTLAKLASGFYRLQGGSIELGGHALTEYSEKALAKHIANVFQDAKLFKKTIYENVAMANPDATREQVMEALHLAQCDEILDHLEKREQTMIGAKGVHLSGGEVQRVAIARAILKNADLVILDEASAAADPENEYELQMALSNLMRGKTVLMIAHRLSSIQAVDEILVMDQGKIIERGTHADLMAGQTTYRRLQEAYHMANEWRVQA